jgi:hypothetical protein
MAPNLAHGTYTLSDDQIHDVDEHEDVAADA